jgi:hypothetical protein
MGVALFAVSMSVSGYCKSADEEMAIGYDGSVGGISFKKFISKDLGFQGILGLSYETAASNAVAPNDETALSYALAVRVLMPKEVTEKIRVNCFAGIELENIGSHTKDAGQTNFYIESGVSPEIFLFKNLSVETSFGLRLCMVGESFKGLDNGYTQIRTFGNAISIVDGVSFHYYF